jgi:hypothetical protein
MILDLTDEERLSRCFASSTAGLVDHNRRRSTSSTRKRQSGATLVPLDLLGARNRSWASGAWLLEGSEFFYIIKRSAAERHRTKILISSIRHPNRASALIFLFYRRKLLLATLYRRLRLSDRRTRRPSPLRTRLCRVARAICHSRGLPTQRRHRFDPNGTSPTRSRQCADDSSSNSPEPCRGALATMDRCARRSEFLTTDAVRLVPL